MLKFVDHIYIFLTIIFTVVGQLVLKIQIGKYGVLPPAFFDKLKFLISIIFDPLIFFGFFSAFLASLAWMGAMTKFKLSYAYPFMSLNFIIVACLSIFILGEKMSIYGYLGTSLIIIGTVMVSRG
jgi:uncharacterized membrane protein